MSWFSDYLSNRCQRVVLPGCKSNTKYVNAGVPQGSILGPLLFLVYINDIVENIESGINLFADHTSLSLVVRNPDDAGNTLQNDINKINTWADIWLVKFNLNKSEIFSSCICIHSWVTKKTMSRVFKFTYVDLEIKKRCSRLAKMINVYLHAQLCSEQGWLSSYFRVSRPI